MSGALAAGCLAVGVLHLVRFALLWTDVAAELSHAAMGVGMAAMFSPLGDPVPDLLWTIVFALAGAWFVAPVLRTGRLAGEAVHHVVGSAAMLFMLLGTHATGPGVGQTGHLAHGSGPDGGLGLASLAAIVLAGYFAWHVLRCSDWLHHHGSTARPLPPSSTGTAAGVALRPALILAPRTAAVAHVVMGAAMTVMLMGMI